MLPFFRADSHKKSPCKMFSLNIIFDQRFLTHQSGKLLVCDAVFGLYMLDLEKVGESPETSFEGLLITDDNDDDDNGDDDNGDDDNCDNYNDDDDRDGSDHYGWLGMRVRVSQGD